MLTSKLLWGENPKRKSSFWLGCVEKILRGEKLKIEPLFDKIVIKPCEPETVTAGGIILPNNTQEKPQIAEVIAVGKGEMIDGKQTVMQVAVGDKVLYPKYAGSEFKLDGQDFVILSQSDLLGKLKD